MSNKIFKEMLQPSKHLARNGFDRSYLQNFTAKIGELLPVMCVETVPGSHYEINVGDMMRTVPMQQSAFIRASQHFEFYFVPYKQLWHRWDDFYTKRSQPQSAAMPFSVPQSAPNAPLRYIISQFQDCAKLVTVEGQRVLTGAQVGDLGEAIGPGCTKIYNLLGYGSCKDLVYNFKSATSVPSWLAQKSVNLFRAAAYQKIFYDYYRQPFYDLPFDGIQTAFNMDDADNTTGLIPAEVTNSDPSNRPFKRYARMFQMHYRQWKKDLFTGILPSTQFGAVAVVDTGSSTGTVQIAQQILENVTLPVGVNNPNVELSTDGLSMWMYDNGSTADSGGTVTIGNNGSSHRNDEDDIFLGNGLDSLSGIPKVFVNGPINASGNAIGNITIPAHQGTIQSTGGFNVLSLVYAQALQRWRETTLRSGFRSIDQYEGHFGVRPVFSDKDKCVFIDSVSSPLQVNTVTNTNAGASIDGTHIPLGDLGANGTSVIGSDKVIKFDAKDFGVIMCIYSMLPEATYQAEGVNMLNTKILPEDFFVPEFENIGMSPVPMSIFRLGENNPFNGYAARYYEYKVNVDVQSDEFNRARVFKDPDSDQDVDFAAGSFYGWSPSRTISLSRETSGVLSPALFARDLYVSPMYFRDIFDRLPYEVDEGRYGDYSAQLTIGYSQFDSFVHQAYFSIRCVQPMSVLGLPNY